MVPRDSSKVHLKKCLKRNGTTVCTCIKGKHAVSRTRTCYTAPCDFALPSTPALERQNSRISANFSCKLSAYRKRVARQQTRKPRKCRNSRQRQQTGVLETASLHIRQAG